MLVSHRRWLQLQALGVALLIAVALFLFLFFRLNICLFGIKMPHLHPEQQQQQPQQPTPTRVIWQPQQSGYQSSQTSTQQLYQTATQQQTSQQPTHTHTQKQTHTDPNTSQTTKQEHASAQSQQQEEPKDTQKKRQTSAQRPSQIPEKPPAAEERREQETERTIAQERRRRANRNKWYKQQPNTERATSPTHTHDRNTKRKQLYDAVRKQAHEKHAASAQPAASGDVYGTSHASENATAVAYETFAGKSDMAIVRASHQMQYYVYTADYIRSMMKVTYTSNRRGELEHLSVTTSSGNTAIDNAILNIIRSAELPPLPPEHKENSITRTITIMIHKAPGSDPVILYISRQ